MKRLTAVLLISGLLVVACSSTRSGENSAGQAAASAQQGGSLPPSAAETQARLAASPRHSEWVVVKTGSDSVRAWIVYPERSTPAPVVGVVHEIFGVSNWIRVVTDQLAADGFIAIAPDLLTKFNLPNTEAGEPNADSARARIGEIEAAQYQPQIRAAAEYALSLPAATKKYGVIGFCWGGEAAFQHAAFFPDVNAVVSYYGPTPQDYTKIRAPVLGLYGEDDARVNTTIARADSASRANNTVYEVHTFAGAGHGFLRAQAGRDGASLEATKQAWPLTLSFLRRYLDQ